MKPYAERWWAPIVLIVGLPLWIMWAGFEVAEKFLEELWGRKSFPTITFNMPNPTVISREQFERIVREIRAGKKNINL